MDIGLGRDQRSRVSVDHHLGTSFLPAQYRFTANAGGSLPTGREERQRAIIVILMDTALRAAGEERDCDERLRRAQEKNTEARQRKHSR